MKHLSSGLSSTRAVYNRSTCVFTDFLIAEQYLLGSCQDTFGRVVFLIEGMSPAGRVAAQRMENPDIIDSYTDAEALEDGVLVAMDALPVNRVTRAVFDHFARPMGRSPVTGVVIDITPLRRAIEAMLAVKADEDGWRCGSYEGKKLWLVPNEVTGLTLMFPEDY